LGGRTRLPLAGQQATEDSLGKITASLPPDPGLILNPPHRSRALAGAKLGAYVTNVLLRRRDRESGFAGDLLVALLLAPADHVHNLRRVPREVRLGTSVALSAERSLMSPFTVNR
jgi:hypothetical protein